MLTATVPRCVPQFGCRATRGARPRVLRVRAVAALALAAAVAALGGEAAADEPVAGAVTPRFEGYLFLDAEGRPLPFQSDEEIERFLATAEVVDSAKIDVGITAPRKLELVADGVRAHAVFKYVDEEKRNVHDRTAGDSRFYLVWRDWYGYDVAAYHVDRLLGLERVPPIVERRVRRQDGSVQIWLEDVMSEGTRQKKGLEPPDRARWNRQHSILHVFDNLVANRDSNLGNTLIDGNWRWWFIDCSRCFGNTTELLFAEAVTHCDRGLWDALRALDRSQAEERLGPVLSTLEIDALFVRRDKLVAHIQALIDQWGESMIIFDDNQENPGDLPADDGTPEG